MSRFKTAVCKPGTMKDPGSRDGWPPFALDARSAEERLPDLPPWFLDQIGMPPETVASHLKARAIPDLRRARRSK